jgi:hypothetical protein
MFSIIVFNLTQVIFNNCRLPRDSFVALLRSVLIGNPLSHLFCFILDTKYIHIKSTTVYVPSPELGLSHPPPPPVARECSSHPGTKGGGDTLAHG